MAMKGNEGVQEREKFIHSLPLVSSNNLKVSNPEKKIKPPSFPSFLSVKFYIKLHDMA